MRPTDSRVVVALLLAAIAPPSLAAQPSTFRIEQTGEQLTLRLPATTLGRDWLLVTRVVAAPFNTLYADSRVSDRIVYWERERNRLLLRQRSLRSWADSAAREASAAEKQDASAILAAVPISSDSNGTISATVTTLFTNPSPELGPGGGLRGTVEPTRSFPLSATNRGESVDVEATLTLLSPLPPPANTPAWIAQPLSTAASVRMHWSFVALPATPMTPRFADRRMNFFSSTLVDYSTRDGIVAERHPIWRWRLERRDSSAAVSDVVKPITYVIDPATPRRWVPWIKRGVEAWNPAFERAGFRHAIVVLDGPPSEDRDGWSASDARYSVIHWLPSSIEDASGQQVVDPRSGEILVADVMLYQNVLKLNRDAFVVQLAPVAADARRLPLSDSLEGQLLAATITHEIGHTLGLGHNFKASSAFMPDSVRRASFLRRWGFTPSIMDYVRFNYVAQPEDGIPLEELIPRIGVFDEMAIRWGYGSDAAAAAELKRQAATQSYLRYSVLGASGSDPGEVTEAVADGDPLAAATLGLRNLGRSVPLLPTIARGDSADAAGTLLALYSRAITQWRTLVANLIPTIGGADAGDVGPLQPRFVPVRRDRALAALDFVSRNGLHVPSFLTDQSLARSLESFGSADRLAQAQRRFLEQLLDNDRLARLAEYASSETLSLAEFTDLLQRDVWEELDTPAPRITLMRQLLQTAFLDIVSDKLTHAPPATVNRQGQFGFRSGASLTSMIGVERAALRAALVSLDRRLAAAEGRSADKATAAHVAEARLRIRAMMSASP